MEPNKLWRPVSQPLNYSFCHGLVRELETHLCVGLADIVFVVHCKRFLVLPGYPDQSVVFDDSIPNVAIRIEEKLPRAPH